MKRKYFFYFIILVLVIIGVFWAVGSSSNETNGEYQFSEIKRGDLKSTISASGTLTPLTIVDIGTQVSGTLDSVYVDFNDHVTSGQILAVLDTVLLKAAVVDAEANVDKAQAQLELAEYQYNLNKKLFDKGMISDADLLPSRVDVKTQQATVKSTEAALARARSNLGYAVIRSPISGTVIDRTIEAGQTVAASFSTPTLFKIAEDLSRMEILADVDESDIGQIKEGQKVTFEVQSYSGVQFDGVVRQVRLQPTTVSNVVTYTVVVDAKNKNDMLLPGMTAIVDFIIEEKNDVLLVPNKALRFQPSEKEIQQALERRKSQTGNSPDSTAIARRSQNASGSGTSRQRPKDLGTVWLLNKEGQLTTTSLKTGMTDGVNTEIVSSRDLTEGMQVISGLSSAETGAKSSSNGMNPGFRPPHF